MDIVVTPEGGESPQPAPVPAAAGSPLINLRAKRAEKLAALHLDLPVPRWDEGDNPVRLVVRYRPVNNTEAINAVEKRQKSKASDWVVLSQIDQLVASCVGVYVRQDGKSFTVAGVDGATSEWVEFDPDTARPDEWVGFSGERAPELAAVLGLDANCGSAALVKAVYFTEGDLGVACAELAAFSTKAAPQADEEALGE